MSEVPTASVKELGMGGSVTLASELLKFYLLESLRAVAA
jgi:spore maturation protein SpmB